MWQKLRVKCINNEGIDSHVTLNKIYNIEIGPVESKYRITDDENKVGYLDKKHFEIIFKLLDKVTNNIILNTKYYNLEIGSKFKVAYIDDSLKFIKLLGIHGEFAISCFDIEGEE